MGGINTKDFEEMQEETSSSCEPTPEKSRCIGVHNYNSRLSGGDFSRTPIQLTKVAQQLEDPRSPTIGIDRTPICSFQNKPKTATATPKASLLETPNSLLDDPRSPTQGIDRTPISEAENSAEKDSVAQEEADVSTDILADPRSPTQGIDRTPIVTVKPHNSPPEVILESSPVTATSPEATGRDVTDLPIKMPSLEDQVEDLSEHIGQELGFNFPPLEEEFTAEKKPQVLTTPRRLVTKRPCYAAMSPVLAPVHLNSPESRDYDHVVVVARDNDIGNTKTAKLVRSPLNSGRSSPGLTARHTNVNYDSPLAIVQRKQAAKLKKAALGAVLPYGGGGGGTGTVVKGSPQYKEEDKENQ